MFSLFSLSFLPFVLINISLLPVKVEYLFIYIRTFLSLYNTHTNFHHYLQQGKINNRIPSKEIYTGINQHTTLDNIKTETESFLRCLKELVMLRLETISNMHKTSLFGKTKRLISTV